MNCIFFIAFFKKIGQYLYIRLFYNNFYKIDYCNQNYYNRRENEGQFFEKDKTMKNTEIVDFIKVFLLSFSLVPVIIISGYLSGDFEKITFSVVLFSFIFAPLLVFLPDYIVNKFFTDDEYEDKPRKKEKKKGGD